MVGDHGTSQVFLWSSARIAGVPVTALLEKRGEKLDDVRTQLENDVRYANITIIEGNDASQYGIGMVCARIAEAVLRDEGLTVPIGAYSRQHGLTLSLPGVIGRRGLREFYPPSLSQEETAMLDRSVAALKKAGERLTKA